MIANTIDAVRIPVPNGAPENSGPIPGRSPSVSITGGSTYVAMNGTRTAKPHIP